MMSKSAVSELNKKSVELERISPNPWNPNEMSEDTYDHLVREIDRTGYIDPILVTPRPEEDDGYRIIDGEHRYRALLENEYTEADVIVLDDVTEEEARLLTLNLNNIKGRHDPVDTAELLDDLRETKDTDELGDILDITEAEMESYDVLLEMPDVDDDDILPGSDGGEDEFGESEPGGDEFVLELFFDQKEISDLHEFFDTDTVEELELEVRELLLLEMKIDT